MNGSRLSSRTDRSNDDVFFLLVPRVICEKRNDWLWSRKSPNFALFFFRFKFAFRSPLSLGCCETCAQTSWLEYLRLCFVGCSSNLTNTDVDKKTRSFHEYFLSDFYWFYFTLTQVLEIHTIFFKN